MTSVLVHRVPSEQIELLDPRAWRTAILDRASAGKRVVTMYGRALADGVLLTAVHEDADSLLVSRTIVDREHGYHELTSELPAMHCFEREVHELHGVRIAGHPWLKPIRFQGQDQASMGAYPWYRVDGKELHEVAVGPIHASVIEPGSFRFSCFGEHVLHLEIHLGYQHRGVEARLLQRDPRALAPLVETIAGDTSVGHAWAYAAALESLAGCPVEPEVELARACMLELERVAMHLAGLSGIAGDIGYLPGASTYGRLRTTAINTSMRLCGSRFGRGAVRPGGTGVALDDELVDLVRDNLALLRKDLPIIDGAFLGARTVRHRLADVGVVPAPLAAQIGAVGMVARSSDIAMDLRSTPRGVFATHPIATCTEPSGDCWARARLRIAEIDASRTWLEHVFASPLSWRRTRATVPALAPGQLAIAVVEGWRGEIVHCLETSSDGALVDYKVQDPSLRNWLALALAVRNNGISDFPVCNKSFDLSYCGNDL